MLHMMVQFVSVQTINLDANKCELDINSLFGLVHYVNDRALCIDQMTTFLSIFNLELFNKQQQRRSNT